MSQAIVKRLNAIEQKLDLLLTTTGKVPVTDASLTGIPAGANPAQQREQLFEVLKMITATNGNTAVKEHTQLALLKMINELQNA